MNACAVISSTHRWITAQSNKYWPSSIVLEKSGLRLPKSILTLRPSLSNWLKIIWELPVCQFLIWQRTSPHWLVGVYVNVCVWTQICLRACVLYSAALTHFQGLWEYLERNKDFVPVLFMCTLMLWGQNFVQAGMCRDSDLIWEHKFSCTRLTIDSVVKILLFTIKTTGWRLR